MRSERAQLPTKLLCSFHILLINTIIAIVTNVPISKIVTIVTIVTITQLPTAYAMHTMHAFPLLYHGSGRDMDDGIFRQNMRVQ